ncbi:MAG: hypothetical protein NZM09_04235, partial [Ignavibacterium sp.]|nr:hypothetical protein [Ignavibacterium sp.]MDW8374886.1 hypothetical protein [Ignavibacteriales bacterium]
MKNLFILSLFFCSFGLFAQQSEDSKVYQLPEIEVISKKIIPLVEKISHSPDYNSSLLSKNGFSVIRRGLNFTQDLYSEGFSRGDIKVIVDGEQYHVACPNRM